MKTIKNIKSNEVKRVTDEVAEKTVVGINNWEYCPKSEWKALRPQKKEKVKKEKK
jgi:hypothetical protein